MVGLITTPTGLRFGQGLIFEPGLGGPGGLTVGGAVIVFEGAGGLSVTMRQNMLESGNAFNASGGLSALPSGAYVTNPATFAGTGSLAATATMALAGSVGFAGSGGGV